MKGKIPHGSNYRQERAKKLLSSSGYARGGKTNEPDGCPTPDNPTCKKSGGPVSGAMPKKRLDKPRRYASGGSVEGDMPEKKKSSAKTQVNIVISGKDSAQPPAAPMLPPPMPGGPPPGAGAPPMPPGAGMMPPGGMKPPGAFKRGGTVKEYPIDAGSGGGKGRLEKAAASKSHRPKRGGK